MVGWQLIPHSIVVSLSRMHEYINRRNFFLPHLSILYLGIMFSRILVAVDSSPCGERALTQAIDLAKRYGAKLIILHVIVRRLYAVTPSEAGVLATAVFVKEVETEGKIIISKAEEAARVSGVDYVCRLVQGVPADEILKTAQQERVDLIVVGSRGLTDVKAFLLGSVSSKVSHRSKCPILIIK